MMHASALAPATHPARRAAGAPPATAVRPRTEPHSTHSFADVRVHAAARAEPAPLVQPRGAPSPRLLASPDPAAKGRKAEPAGVPLRFRKVCVGTASPEKEEPRQDTPFESDLADSRADRLAEPFEEGQWMVQATGHLGRGPAEPVILADLGHSLSGGVTVGESSPDVALAGEEPAGAAEVVGWMVKALTAHTIPPRLCVLVPDRAPQFPRPQDAPARRRTPRLHSDLLSGRGRYSGSLGVPPLRADVPRPTAPAGPVREGPEPPPAPSLDELIRGSWRIVRARRRRAAARGVYSVFRSAAGPAPAVAPPIVHDVLRSAGAPLDSAVRARMEPRLGHSFADVRIHTDGRAAESARAVGAHAYAVGRDVVFGVGRYAPGSAEGDRLIAHELAHVVQQRGAPAALHRKLEIGAADDAAERQADAAAAAVMGGGLAPAAWTPAGGAVLRRIPHDPGTGGGGPPRDVPREPAGEARDAGADAGTGAGAERERAVGLEELIEQIIRFVREVVRVLEQGSRMPAPLPRETGPAPQSCLFTFDTQADLDARKAHWAGVIAGMPAADAIGWMIGRFTPPRAATTEATTQKDCLLEAIRASAATAGSPLRLPAGNLTFSGRRDFADQEWIWRRKFEFWTRAELTARERARGRTGFTARTARFDRVSQHAVDTCGSLAGSAGGRWDPDNPAHRVCWNVPAAPGTTAPPIPAGKTHLSEDERQQEILQASSAPGISRHHAGTDFDLFDGDMNPREWETGGTFADEYSWMMRNASRYGFIQSFTAWSTFMSTGYMEERWHWSYYPIGQALLEFGRANQAALGTRLMAEWGSSPQFSYIRANWRSYVFNVAERGVF